MNTFSEETIKIEVESFRVKKEEWPYKNVIKDIRLRFVLTDEKKRTAREFFVFHLHSPNTSFIPLEEVTKDNVYQWLNQMDDKQKNDMIKRLKDKLDPVEYQYVPEYGQ